VVDELRGIRAITAVLAQSSFGQSLMKWGKPYSPLLMSNTIIVPPMMINNIDKTRSTTPATIFCVSFLSLIMSAFSPHSLQSAVFTIFALFPYMPPTPVIRCRFAK